MYITAGNERPVRQISHRRSRFMPLYFFGVFLALRLGLLAFHSHNGFLITLYSMMVPLVFYILWRRQAMRRSQGESLAYTMDDSLPIHIHLRQIQAQLREEVDDSTAGVNQSLQTQFVHHKFAEDTSKDSSTGETCSICLADYEADEDLCRLPCGHDFHDQCISIWIENHSKCPLCNLDLNKPVAL